MSPSTGELLLPLLLPLGGVGGLLFIDGGVDCVGQLALASITDPSGHVCVDGDVGGVVALL